jgi:hypothetical protein
MPLYRCTCMDEAAVNIFINRFSAGSPEF